MDYSDSRDQRQNGPQISIGNNTNQSRGGIACQCFEITPAMSFSPVGGWFSAILANQLTGHSESSARDDFWHTIHICMVHISPYMYWFAPLV